MTDSDSLLIDSNRNTAYSSLLLARSNWSLADSGWLLTDSNRNIADSDLLFAYSVRNLEINLLSRDFDGFDDVGNYGVGRRAVEFGFGAQG
jgi:hypothetical protein